MKNTNNIVYGKKEALMMSGIAILLMIGHHFFGFPILYKDGISYISILGDFNFNEISVEQLFASYGKICVSIYAFNTGYAIWSSQSSFNYSKIPYRIFKFIVSYWIIYSLFMLYAFIVDENMPPLKNFLLNLLGLGVSHDFVNISSAWYVSFYVSILAISPILVRLFQTGWIKNCIASIILILMMYLLKIYTPDYNIITWIFKVVCGFISFNLSSVLIGIFVCKYDIFNRIDRLIGVQNTITYFCFILFTILVRPLFGSNFNVDTILVVILIYSILCILRSLNLRKIETGLYYLGIYSMNMWFVQPIFYTGKYPFLQTILFSPKYSILIYIWCVILIFFLAVGCTHFQNIIFNACDKLNLRYTSNISTSRN